MINTLLTINLRGFVVILWTLIWSTIGIISILLDPTGHFYSFLAHRGWSRQIMWLGGCNVTVKGGEAVDWKRPYVICANHQSQMDIPLLFAHIPAGVRFLAKRSLFYIPIFGWMLAIARFIPVDRGKKGRARKSIMKAAKKMGNGPSLLVFPEGTRTHDGSLQPFKSGAFIIGIQAGVPILPVAIKGTYDILPRDYMNIRPGRVTLTIGDPIETDQLTIKDKQDLGQQTYDAVARMLDA